MKSIFESVLILLLTLPTIVVCSRYSLEPEDSDENYDLIERLASQQVLAPPHEEAKKGKVYRLPLRSEEYVFVTTIALGSPPQPYHAAIDLGWTRSMALSSECSDWTCDPDFHWLYDCNKSSTFVPVGTKGKIFYNDGEYDGHLSQDTLHLLGLKIQNQTFHEATSLEVTGFDFLWDLYDGLLGLSPPNLDESSKASTAVLSRVVSQGKLKSNVISLKVPSWNFFEEDRGGEVLFGDIDHSNYKGDLTYISLTNESSDPVLDTKWTVNATSVRFSHSDEEKDVFNEPLTGFSAVVNLGIPVIALPGYLIAELMMLLRAEEIPGYPNEFWYIPCSRVDSLPDFTISLSGKEFTLTPQQYTRRTEIWYDEDGCLLAFGPVENYFDRSSLVGSVFPKKPAIILGSWFLHYFYTVLDMEEWRVGFAKAKIGEEE